MVRCGAAQRGERRRLRAGGAASVHLSEEFKPLNQNHVSRHINISSLATKNRYDSFQFTGGRRRRNLNSIEPNANEPKSD